jgi:PEP-CTERM motif-containing protein
LRPIASKCSVRSFCAIAVLTAVFLSIPSHSFASPITYSFELLVTGFRGDATLFSGVDVGETFNGFVTFDPDTAHVGETISFNGGPTRFEIDGLPMFDSTSFYVDHSFDYALSVSQGNVFFALYFALSSLGADPLQFPSIVGQGGSYFDAAFTNASGNRGVIEGVTESFSQVPEPTTLALTLTGAFGLWLSRRRSSKARADQ